MFRPETKLVGQRGSSGIAIGPIALEAALEAGVEPPRETAASVERELARFEAARLTAAEALEVLMGAGDATAAEILEFQVAMIGDSALIEPTVAAIRAGQGAATAWSAAIDREIANFSQSDDAYFRARASDIADLKERVRDQLLGVRRALEPLADGAILVARDLPPSRFLEIDWTRAGGLALRAGSASSHLAMLARARGLPLVVGIGGGGPPVASGGPAILDADEGCLVVDPEPDTLARYQARLAESRAEAAHQAKGLTEPAYMANGEPVQVLINIDDPKHLAALDVASCDGVGLTRTEFLFHGRATLPDEAAQYAVYRQIMEWAAGKPVTIRTLDAGGDKPIAGLTPTDETNPFLGLRGVRLSLARPEIFHLQLRALARAAALGPLKIMIPMVTRPAELAATRALLDVALAELENDGLEARRPELGMMVEVPASALNIAAFEADFYSIGSNDLTQYVTAAGRDITSVQDLYDPFEPGVLELIGRVARHGAATGKEVSLCGEMAAEPRGLKVLLALGLRTVSVAPASLARVKTVIRAYG